MKYCQSNFQWSHSSAFWGLTLGTDQKTVHETVCPKKKMNLVLICTAIRVHKKVSGVTRASFYFFLICKRGSSKTKLQVADSFNCDACSVWSHLIIFCFPLSSLKRLVLHTRYWQTPKRRSFTIDMENRGYGREEVEGLAWMISSLTFLVEDCLASWGGRAEDGMEARGEGMTWYILWSKYDSFNAFSIILILSTCIYISITLSSHRVSLEDLYNGKTTKLQLSKNVLCGACNGWV